MVSSVKSGEGGGGVMEGIALVAGEEDGAGKGG